MDNDEHTETVLRAFQANEIKRRNALMEYSGFSINEVGSADSTKTEDNSQEV